MVRLRHQSGPRDLLRECGGAVYVEFLVAIVPVVTLFLAICQLALIGVAELVVHHAALRAVRTAIVTLEEEPSRFGGVARGVLSGGSRETGAAEALLGRFLGDSSGASVGALSATDGREQQGARIGPIRTAAYVPLLALAPNARLRGAGRSLAGALSDPMMSRLSDALDYTRAATAVTVMAGPRSDALALEPIGPYANVTIRVTYLFSCEVPLIRVLVCDTEPPSAPASSADAGPVNGELLRLRENARGLAGLGVEGVRVYLISAEATLPNQGAEYVMNGGSS